MEIAALVSGGVDSSVVVHQLKEAGYDPTIFYIRIGMEDKDGYIDCPAEEDIEITSYIAKKYGCRFEIVSLHDEYWDRVVSYTIDSVKRGLTPNPDMMCNKYIKFGCFEEKWGKDFDKIATGHYATTTEIDGKVWLSTAKDPVKDQTDFLGQITRLQIQKLMFPIGHLMKSEVRAIAEQQKLPSAKRKDSQGICFLGKINYNDFIERYLGKRTGKIVELETGKVLGKHNGYWFHTIGQRKGLGLSGGPWFVIKKDIKRNIIYVSNGYQHARLRLHHRRPMGRICGRERDHFQDPPHAGLHTRPHPSHRRLIPHRIRQQNPRNSPRTVRSSLRQRPSSLPRQWHDY